MPERSQNLLARLPEADPLRVDQGTWQGVQSAEWMRSPKS